LGSLITRWKTGGANACSHRIVRQEIRAEAASECCLSHIRFSVVELSCLCLKLAAELSAKLKRSRNALYSDFGVSLVPFT
jgi:hypothetical protein